MIPLGEGSEDGADASCARTPPSAAFPGFHERAPPGRAAGEEQRGRAHSPVRSAGGGGWRVPGRGRPSPAALPPPLAARNGGHATKWQPGTVTSGRSPRQARRRGLLPPRRGQGGSSAPVVAVRRPLRLCAPSQLRGRTQASARSPEGAALTLPSYPHAQEALAKRTKLYRRTGPRTSRPGGGVPP